MLDTAFLTNLAALNCQWAEETGAVFVIFGATGDLSRRKLVPALYNLLKDGHLRKDFFVVLVGRRDGEKDALLQSLAEGMSQYSRTQPIDPAIRDALLSQVVYVAEDFGEPSGFSRLRAILEQRPLPLRLFYLATPSSLYPSILDGLSAAHLIGEHADADCQTRVVFEKPFGRDLDSAIHLNALARAHLDESQIYRMDHYLGKETVQNILVFRFGNSLFEPLWNRKYVSRVRIIATEDIGIVGRGRFYEETGIIRDVLQNHLLQIAALSAMEAPVSFEADRIRDERAKVFRAFRPLYADQLSAHAIFGQYDGYTDADEVAADSRIPTFAALRLFIDNWRWEGVPFEIIAGKSLGEKSTRVEIHFRSVPFCLFGKHYVCEKLDPNILTLRIQPEEGISMQFSTKTPGDTLQVSPVRMNFDYRETFSDKAQQEAYEKLLLDALRGDPTLFARQDEVELMWRYVAPLIEATEAGTVPLHRYAPGGSGPKEVWK
ncbi:MAG: glucose-6-phosphate dehydrogenase [Myxococcales bacterium]|jgi:glucose-6-phosphate 1-dehydrogenase|nr:glucose-6-phosphate dehydrogenase [Myxococcales bacterium]